MNQIITLLSDWHLRDPYVAMLKGSLLQTLPDAQIIDITHYVDKFNVLQTALLMKSSYSSFPEGSIHLILTNMSLNSTFSPVMLEHKGHYFIGEDNGVFHLMFGQEVALKGLQLSDNKENTLNQILHWIRIINDGSLNEQNTDEYKQFKRMFVQEPEYTSENQQIEGNIIYIDAFNNAITDIPVKMFEEKGQQRPFTATIHSKGVWIMTRYFHHYESADGEMYLCDNALGLLEVASYQSDVAILTDLEPGDKIIIQFEQA
jgi:hypothetical protein